MMEDFEDMGLGDHETKTMKKHILARKKKQMMENHLMYQILNNLPL